MKHTAEPRFARGLRWISLGVYGRTHGGLVSRSNRVKGQPLTDWELAWQLLLGQEVFGLVTQEDLKSKQ